MAQTKKMSLIETATNMIIGLAISWSVTYWIIPFWGFHYTVAESLEITMVFFVISTIRLYGLRRIFNYLEDKHGRND